MDDQGGSHLHALLPIAAATAAVLVALVTATVRRRLARNDVLFVALNLSIALWCLAYGLDLAGLPVSSTGQGGAPAFVLWSGQLVAVSTTPLLWFLFAATQAGRTEWLRPPRLLIVSVPLAYTLTVGLTNPLHALFAIDVGDAIAYGPLMLPHHLGTFALVLPGVWWAVSARWRRGGGQARRQATELAVACALPLAGGLAWILRAPLDLPLRVNPVPTLFSVLTVVLLRQLLTGGFEHLFPRAALDAFEGMSDAAVITDADGFVMSLNRAAAGLLPTSVRGRPIGEAFPEVEPHVASCLGFREPVVRFEAERGGSVFYGRAHLMTERRGRILGCLVLLTDITDVRLAQEELAMAMGEERATMAARA